MPVACQGCVKIQRLGFTFQIGAAGGGSGSIGAGGFIIPAAENFRQTAQPVRDERPGKPLSDSKLAELLLENGIKVARRAVAKYREALSIAPSHERRRQAS